MTENAAEGRIHSLNVNLRLPGWELTVGTWQHGEKHGWKINGLCTRCRIWATNCPGPTPLLAFASFRDSVRGHRPYCYPPNKDA